MDFKVDQNLPEEVLQVLRSDGHNARNVYEEQLDGRPDLEISAALKRESRALITPDLDFADIRAYPLEQYSGLLVFRLHRQDKPAVLRASCINAPFGAFAGHKDRTRAFGPCQAGVTA